jgi:putative ABC transport system ATP-binding protein
VTEAAVVEAQDLWRTYPSGGSAIHAVAGINLAVARGEFVALTGRSGSGKTTLLNLLGGLDRPTSGAVRLAGLDLARLDDQQMTRLRRERLGFVFQSYGLIPTLSALENVELPLHLMGWRWRRRQERARDTLKRTGIGERAAHRIYELSGGEQQRVAIARAIAGEPALIIADEPTGSLDTASAAAIWQLLSDLVREGATLVVATHDLSVRDFATRSLHLQDGQLLEGMLVPDARGE